MERKTMKETLGQRLAGFRKNLGLRQEDIAEKVNVSAQAVSKWENDLSAPDISALPILADILNVSLDELLGREVSQTKVVPIGERKDVNSMILKINISSRRGDTIKVNLPLSIIKLCLDAGVELPCVNGQESLKNIDFNQILMMVESGVVGKLVEIESSEGDTIYITVE